jgi:ribosomal protein S18 acetylase RimI-like enzyme
MDIVIYDPQKHKDQMIKLFKGYPEMFPDDEIREIVKNSIILGSERDIKLVAEENGIIHGFVELKETDNTQNVWQIKWIAVLKDTSRKGIGTALLDRALGKASAKSLSKVFVETSGRKEGMAARAFYEKSGFEKVSEIKNFYPDGESKVIFCKVV